MLNKKFEGWYFKHQTKNETVAFIVGSAQNGDFIQVATNEKSWHFDTCLLYTGDSICCDGGFFSQEAISINLPSISGEIFYGPMTKIKGDIMGPFALLPMQCRHGIISMYHTLNGYLIIEGNRISFDNGIGYIEKDSGVSFPSEYLWLHCSDFKTQTSIVASVAKIPFVAFDFTGCICAIIHNGKHYRFATYNGVKILKATKSHIRLLAKHCLLDIIITSLPKSVPLRSPINGKMDGTVEETSSASARFRLWDNKRLVLDDTSDNVSFEFFKTQRKCTL